MDTKYNWNTVPTFTARSGLEEWITSFQEMVTSETSESSLGRAEENKKTSLEIFNQMQILTFHTLFLQNQLSNYLTFSLSRYKQRIPVTFNE